MFHDEDTAEFTPQAPPIQIQSEAVKGEGIEIAAMTHKGHVRAGNEDHFAVIRRHRSSSVVCTSLPPDSTPSTGEEAWLLLIADGLGGEAAGEEASESAIRTVLHFANSLSSWVMRPTGRPRDDLAERAELYAEAIQKELRLQAAFTPELAGMGTTLTGAYVMGDEAIIINVGDSRTYLARRHQLVQLTKDHTVAQEMQDLGNSPDDVKAFRHVLTRCFGTTSESVTIDMCHVSLLPGDHLMLCSDGLSDMVSDDSISKLIRTASSVNEGCDSLVNAALNNGGRDNVTTILARILEPS